MILKKVFLPLSALVLILSCKKETVVKPVIPYNPEPVVDSTFTNPLLPAGPDPWIIKKDSFYYYTNTTWSRLAIWKTKAVSELKNASSKTIFSPPATGPNSMNLWAPELHYLDNKWYTYYTAGSSTNLGTQRMFVLENPSQDPTEGTWTSLGQLADVTNNYFAIDATIFEHENKLYLIYSGHPNANDNSQYLYIVRMTNPYTVETARVEISRPTYSWEKIGGPPFVNEGPEILRNAAGKVFLVYSVSGCWTDDYALAMLTLKDGGNPLNPSDWTKSPTPVFTKSPMNNAFGPGHNSFFKSQDGTEDWILYHANPSSNLGCGDTRNPRMQKFGWNTDGTPNFGTPVKSNVEILKPSGEY